MVFGGGNIGGAVGTGIIFSLHNQFSATSRKIEGDFKRLEGVTDTATRNITKGLNMMRTGFLGLVIGGAILASLSFPVRAAIAFESAFTGVRKTVTATEPEFQKISQAFRNIAREVPIAATELALIGELAGQLGVKGVENIIKFTDTISKIAVTTNLTSEAASTAFARILGLMQEPINSVDRMGAAVVELGNKFKTSEAEIIPFATRIAAAGRVAGLTTAQILGISAAFTSAGVGAERGGTAVSKVLFGMAAAAAFGGQKLKDFAKVAGLTANQFKTLFEKDAAKAFDLFVAGLGERGIKAIGLLEELELADSRLKFAFVGVAGAGGVMTEAIEKSTKAWKENIALTREAELRFATTESQLKIMANNFTDLGITIGNIFLPVIRAVSFVLKLFAQVLNAVASTVIGKVILGVVAAMAALIVVMGIAMIVMGGLRFASAKAAIGFASMGKTAIAAAFATGGLTAGFSALAAAVWTALAPLLPILAVLAALVGIFFFLKKTVSEFNEILDGTSKVAGGFLGFMQRIGGVLAGVFQVFKSANSEGFTMSKKMRDTLKDLGILEIIISIGTFAVRVKAIAEGMLETFKIIWEGMKVVGNLLLDMINKLFDHLNEMGFDLKRLTGDVETWIEVGRILGWIVGVLLVVAFIAAAIVVAIFAVTMFAAALPIIILIALIWGIIWVIQQIPSVLDWFAGLWFDFVDFLTNTFDGFVSWLDGLVDGFFNFGSSMVTAIGDGIAAGWDQLVTWFLQLIAAFPGGELLLESLGVNITGTKGGVAPGADFTPQAVSSIGAATAAVNVANAQALQPTIIDNTVIQERIKIIKIEMDGRELKSRMEEFEEDDENRR